MGIMAVSAKQGALMVVLVGVCGLDAPSAAEKMETAYASIREVILARVPDHGDPKSFWACCVAAWQHTNLLRQPGQLPEVQRRMLRRYSCSGAAVNIETVCILSMASERGRGKTS